MRRPVSRLLASLALIVAAGAACAAQDRYTVFAELRAPYASSRAALQKILKAEGHEVAAEGDREVALVLTAAQITKLFGARIVYHKVGASSRSGIVDEAYLESATIPRRLAKYIRRVYFDPQRG